MIDHPRYALAEAVSSGSQGRVVRVVDRERPGLELVAKIPVALDADAVVRLEGEFALLARLRVPGLPRVHDFARDRHRVPFFVEDFVRGTGPAIWLGRDAKRLRSLAADLAETLASLHEAGFVHGDVKPANVVVPEEGRAVLLDLGASVAARAAAEVATMSTPAFAAPEVQAGGHLTPASDLYGLGATLWTCATGAPPARGKHAARDLRARAPWVPPSLAAILERLVEEHPADRPSSAFEVLVALGRAARGTPWEGAGRGPSVREEEVAKVLLRSGGVLFVTGPSGSGKSHLLREVATRAALGGQAVRTVRFPDRDASFVARFIAFLRTDDAPSPFPSLERPALVLVDEVEAAPAEVLAALDALRCRASPAREGIAIVAAVRKAPEGATTIALGPLVEADLRALVSAAEDRGSRDDRDVASLVRESGGSPGWLFAALGRVPLTREAALERVSRLPGDARTLLALVATLGGIAETRLLRGRERGLPSLFRAGLLVRDRETLRLPSPDLAHDLAEALADFAVSDAAAEIALSEPDLPSSVALVVASAHFPPARRSACLAAAASRARREGARSTEIDALLALSASKDERTAERLARLERLTRDAGISRAHPQVLAWLEEAGEADRSVAGLALRRRAEERARAGDFDAAEHFAKLAVDHAVEDGRTDARAYALATVGAVALYRAEHRAAALALAEARALSEESELAGVAVDREELARLEHNAGVVALYANRCEEAASAFERSLAIKRALGDRAGVRACLLNLGLARTRTQTWAEAEAALQEGTTLAESLGQEAGRAWCLVAWAELEIRRARPEDAERLIAEAEGLEGALPAAVKADLALLRAELALLEGDGHGAASAISTLADGMREADALIDARASIIEARAHLATLPADRRSAARAALAAARRARASGLAAEEQEALRVLRSARRATLRTPRATAMPPSPASPERAWKLLADFANAPLADCAERLARLVVDEAGAERAFVALIDGEGGVERAWGADIDGLAVADAEKRVDRELVHASFRRGASVYRSDLETAGGRGARLAVARDRAAVVCEHRFRAGAFDAVTDDMTSRWIVMAAIVARLSSDVAFSMAGERPAAPSPTEGYRAGPAEPMSTAMPRREPLREYPRILGRSAALRRALAQLDAAVDSDLPVLVRGETGTGKELFAKALHEHGPRHRAPFVAVNCGAIPDALLEAELFGHAKGAFTGADRARPGLFARAEGGTLLLDEVGELPLLRQASLLRALETGRYRPVGADDERPFDVRVVAATNRDLEAAVSEGTFRRDLLFRVRVLEIVVPPLRERGPDIELLFAHFLASAGGAATLSPGALTALQAHAFPGNVRELAHLALRLAAMHLERIEAAHLPREVRAAAVKAVPPRADPRSERREVEDALARTAGNISHAASLLGLTRHGLKKRMLRLGLRAKREGT